MGNHATNQKFYLKFSAGKGFTFGNLSEGGRSEFLCLFVRPSVTSRFRFRLFFVFPGTYPTLVDIYNGQKLRIEYLTHFPLF